ncbi:hypothetical protein LSH36_1995g00000 [Paralvinella palmiformis]|uniref:Uncharacterized protein n=1 Tax=Paralvinella palmiformis TaxID=53620 RepID=A0AAD9MQE9_9ANNE|nr:hypothetical protein LSH36_1995g00000 [Paralvinella palmiformis]
MKLPKSYVIVMLISCCHLISSIPTFTSWPNVVGSYKGKSATLTWILSEPLTKDWYSVSIQYDKSSESISVCIWNGYNPNNVGCKEEYRTRVTANIKVGSKIISLNLNNLQPDDVIYNYKCTVRYEAFSPSVINNMAWIMLYGK